MKRIILSEGENDTIFLKELLTQKMAIEESKILFFDQNPTDDGKKLRFIEENYFERLESEWLPFELLVKSEGGKSKVMDVSISKLTYLCTKGYVPIMVIDLDGGQMCSFINRFKEKLTNRFKGINLTAESNELHKIDEAVMYSLKLSKNAHFIGTIFIIGFCQTLGSILGIDNTPCTEEETQNRSQKYISKSKIHEMFNKALK